MINKILAGDKKVVMEFYKTYSLKILCYLVKRVPKEDAEELMQDVFLEAIDQLPLLRKRQSLLSWLFTIAHNKTVDYYRKKKIKTILLSKIPYLQIIDKEVHEPEFIYEKNLIREKIEKAFRHLSCPHQKILRLRYEEGLKIKELCPIFNLSSKATESLLFRARKSFQKAYERT